MFGVFQNLSLSGATAGYIFHADVRQSFHFLRGQIEFRCKAQQMLKAILESPRCGRHMLSYQLGGVLILGTDMVSPIAVLRYRSRALHDD